MITEVAGDIKATYVIHAVGPQNNEDFEKTKEDFADTIINILESANFIGAKSIAIPAISSG